MNQRIKFLLLIAVFLVPTLASFIVFYFFPPEKTGNYGELVSPIVTLQPTPLSRLDHSRAVIGDSLRGKWLLITRDTGACEEPCRKKLYAMRQARLMLGRDQDRILLVILVDDDIAPSTQLQKEFDGAVWIAARSSPWLASLPSNGNVGGRAWIHGVDPLGNVFIRYSADPDIRKMSRDLQRVLKASQIG